MEMTENQTRAYSALLDSKNTAFNPTGGSLLDSKNTAFNPTGAYWILKTQHLILQVDQKSAYRGYLQK